MLGRGRNSRAALTAVEEIRLIAGAKHGDHGAFESLVESYMGKAIGVAVGYVGNRDEAIDMAQEAFYRVFKNLDRFREGERFAPWFFRILRNACLNHLQKRKRRRAFSYHARDEGESDFPIVDGSLGPADRAELTEEQRQFWIALEELSLKHREILLLRHFEDLEYAAIAEVLDIPIGTVMSRLFHARRKLRDALADYMETQG